VLQGAMMFGLARGLAGARSSTGRRESGANLRAGRILRELHAECSVLRALRMVLVRDRRANSAKMPDGYQLIPGQRLSRRAEFSTSPSG